MSVYGPGFARVQSEGLSPAILEAVPWLVGLIGGRGTYYDVGCGDGTLMMGLRNAGLQGRGCDLSEHMVEIGQSRGLPIIRGDARAAAIPPSDLITAIGEVLCYRDEAGDSLKSLLRMGQSLKPGGALVFDVIGPTMYSSRGWIDDPSGTEWHCAFEFERDGWELTRRTHVWLNEGLGWRREDESHMMTVCTSAMIETMLRTAGLKVERVSAYGKYNLPPGRLGFVARKPA